jgi:hypothetical protein
VKRRALALAGLLALSCKKDDPAPAPQDTPAEPAAKTDVPKAEPGDESAHVVVFSDRATQAYLLLVPQDRSTAPTRAALATLVTRGLDEGPEVADLLQLVEREPVPPGGGGDANADERDNVRRQDLLGLHIETLPITGKGGVIPPEHLAADVLVRALTPEERASLPERTHAIMLRAQYRNRDAVRGLRLLQTLVRLVASDRDALIHDPDTQETMSVEAFSERRLRASLGNIADQVVVVPFPSERHGDGVLRLASRGMRRFGGPDLELDGLPADPAVLQRATLLLHGLAYQMVRLGEYDSTGYAVQLDDEIDVGLDDVRKAYSSREASVPACDDCPQHVSVHLVERETEPHDPTGQVVVRVVAPRSESDAPAYDQRAWARRAVEMLLGA